MERSKSELLCMMASPRANEFLEGGYFKNWIPFLYRAIEYRLFNRFKNFQNFNLYEYENKD